MAPMDGASGAPLKRRREEPACARASGPMTRISLARTAIANPKRPAPPCGLTAGCERRH
jgi:hypothetical protein